MRVLDAGHRYELESYDKNREHFWPVWLRFMKRIGDGYPGNDGSPYPGTNCQEALRAVIDRVKYLDGQDKCVHNDIILHHLRDAIWQFEVRAAERRGPAYTVQWHQDLKEWSEEHAHSFKLEEIPTCDVCGHIFCREGHPDT